MGRPQDPASALHIIERDGPSLGLHLNRCQSLLFLPEDADESISPLPPDIPVTRCGFSLLGCMPYWPPDFCKEVFQARLSKMWSSPWEISLLRSCLALPKVSYALCACPPPPPPPNYICRSTADFDKSRLSAKPWCLFWAGSCQTGRGSRLAFLVVGVATSEVPLFMPPLLFWLPVRLLCPW